MQISLGRARLPIAGMTAMLFLSSLVLLLAPPSALGLHGGDNSPETECASGSWNGEWWKINIEDGVLGEVETNIEDDAILILEFESSGDGFTVTWENNSDDAVFRIVRFGGGTHSANIEGLWAPGEGGTFTVDDDISHITWCFTDEGATTTTPTTEGSTPTTEGTTPTTEGTTPTTEGTTPTTEGSTTTTVGDEVEGIVITTTSTTTTVADEVRGIVITTTSTTSSTTSSTVGDTVLSTEVLPFTGLGTGALALLAASTVALGLVLIAGSRREET